MASIISAGTTSGTSLNLSGDTSGVLQLATNGSTTAVTIDTSQNVGIGTASPTSRLVVQQANNTGDAFRVFANGTDTQLITRYLSSSDVWQISASFASTGAYKPITFFTSDAERMRITSGGYSKFSNSGSYVGSSGSYHEFTNDNPATESLIVRNTSTSQTASTLEVRGGRNTSNNSFNAIAYYNAAAADFRFRVADSGAIATVGGIALGTATPATSGIGVQFPATQSASSDANTLDDYEEGTWTPTISIGGSTTGITYSNQVARYTKIGNMVYISGYLSLASNGGLTGAVNLNGFPFATANISNLFHAPAFGWYTGATGITAGIGLDIAPNTTGAPMVYFTNTTALTLGHAQITNTFAIEWTFAYRTA